MWEIKDNDAYEEELLDYEEDDEKAPDSASIKAADSAKKREELKVFSGEVVHFGNRCKDPQWHNLDRYFEKLGSELTPEKQLKDEAEAIMQQLMSYVQYTAELYHELHALDRFEKDYRRKLQEEDNSTAVQRGDSLLDCDKEHMPYFRLRTAKEILKLKAD